MICVLTLQKPDFLRDETMVYKCCSHALAWICVNNITFKGFVTTSLAAIVVSFSCLWHTWWFCSQSWTMLDYLIFKEKGVF